MNEELRKLYELQSSCTLNAEQYVGEVWRDRYEQLWTIIAASYQGERGLAILLHGPQLRAVWYSTLMLGKTYNGEYRWFPVSFKDTDRAVKVNKIKL